MKYQPQLGPCSEKRVFGRSENKGLKVKSWVHAGSQSYAEMTVQTALCVLLCLRQLSLAILKSLRITHLLQSKSPGLYFFFNFHINSVINPLSLLIIQ